MGYTYAQRKIHNELTEMVTENISLLNHEFNDNQHYLYDRDSGVFAGQGATLEEAAEHFSELNEGQVGHVIPKNGAEFFIVNGKIETINES